MTTSSASAMPPLSRAARIAAGASLIIAGLTNGLAQYVVDLLASASGAESFSDQIRWGAEHPAIHQTEQAMLLLSMLFLPIGLLALAQVSRWRAPRITAVAVPLLAWGMWGFHNIIALGYAAGSVAPGVIGVDEAVALNEGFGEHQGSLWLALVPHLVGSLVGFVLLAIACWRSGAFARTPLVLLLAFLVWDFLLPAFGPFEPHLLLAAALAWLGVDVMRMGDAAWHGRSPRQAPVAEPILNA